MTCRMVEEQVQAMTLTQDAPRVKARIGVDMQGLRLGEMGEHL
jgi:hypothetical protein